MTLLAQRSGLETGAVRVEVRPDSELGSAGPGAPAAASATRDRAADLMGRLRVAYGEGLARYQQELGMMTVGDPATATSRYPELPVAFDAGAVVLVEETVAVDGALWEQLFEIYLVYGWDGIRRVEQAIAARAPQTPAAGVLDSQWGPAWRFFRFTRNLLAMLIGDTLAGLERLAATRMVGHLRQVREAVDYAFTVRYRVQAAGTTYRFGDQEASTDLFAALSDAVRQRVAYEELLQRTARVRNQLQQLRGIAARARERGRPLSSERQLARELDVEHREQEQLERHAAGLLQAAKVMLDNNAPFGLLVLEGLPAGFSKPEMEQQLGAILSELRSLGNMLGEGIDPRRSHTAELLPELVPPGHDAWSELQHVRVPDGGPEAAVVAAATTGLPRQPGWFPMIHPPTLELLVESGAIPRDSFTFVVLVRYLLTLGDRLDAERQAEEASTAFWSAFGRAAAVANLVLLVTPAGVGAALGTAARAAELVMLAHTVSSVTQQLLRVSQLQREQLLHPEAFSLEGLGRLGELGLVRERLLVGIGQELLIELVLTAAGARWPRIRKLLTVYGYLEDVQTLLGEG